MDVAKGDPHAMSRRRLLGLGIGVAASTVRRDGTAARTQPVASPDAAHPDFRVRFVRHAESQINVLRTIAVPGQQLPPDSGVTYPLTRRGVEQAIALGESLQNDPILAIVSSPRLRCTQTADAIAFAKGMTIELAPGLVEVAFVDPAGSMSAIDSVAVLQTIASWTMGDRAAHTPDGESLDEVLARFLPVVTEAIDRFATQPGDLLVVSHSITLSAALPFVFENLSPDWALTNMLPNAAIATGAVVDRTLTCTDWNGLPPG
jgi:probable phosphoglycerate mutase